MRRANCKHFRGGPAGVFTFECAAVGRCKVYCHQPDDVQCCETCELYEADYLQAANHPGLGDRVEQALASVGITKDRYAEAKRALGLPPSCGCKARQEWLNRAGEWWAKRKG